MPTYIARKPYFRLRDGSARLGKADQSHCQKCFSTGRSVRNALDVLWGRLCIRSQGLISNISSTNPVTDLEGRAIKFDFNIPVRSVGVNFNGPLDGGDFGYLEAFDTFGTLIGQTPVCAAGGFVGLVSDAPVTVTGVEVNREGDGVSYVSLGFPGATVQLLQKLAEDNLADDLKRVAPDVIVLAFGTNEGFNDALDVAGGVAVLRKLFAECF